MQPGQIIYATMPNTQNVTGTIELLHNGAFVVFVPTVDNGTLEIETSPDGQTWYPVKDSTPTQIAKTGATTGLFLWDADVTSRLSLTPFARIKSSVNQTADRVFAIVAAHA